MTRDLGASPESHHDATSFRFAMMTTIVALVGVFTIAAWFLTFQRLGLAPRRFGSDFYDVQARRWFHGSWSMPAPVLGPEGVKSISGLQMYFGPFPSVLRVPVLLVTDRFDGRLTQPSVAQA